MSRLRAVIKKIPGARRLYFFLRWRRMENGFHGDLVMRKFVLTLLNRLPVSAFVETGTYQGDTTEFVAKYNPSLKILSCECNSKFFTYSRRRLRRFPNVQLYNQSSEKFLSLATSESLLGSLPLFYLDAHWYSYWPLRDEIAIITRAFRRGIIMIDDFEVPGRPDFKFQRGDGSSSIGRTSPELEEVACDLVLLRPRFAEMANDYRILFPSYNATASSTSSLVGFVAIFRGLESEFEDLVRQDWIRQHFREYAINRGYRSQEVDLPLK